MNTEPASYPVLVVDDQPTTRLLLTHLLEHQGYVTKQAVSGEAALALAEQQMFAAILLDYQMDGIDGVETCKRFRAMEAYRLTPILLITVADETDLINDAFAAGCDDYLVKPINHIVLQARLKAHIHRSELYVQLAKVHQMLNRYISPRTQVMVEQYAGTGRFPPPARSEVCVLFTDIRGFTQLSQQVSPEFLFAMLSQHLSYQVELVYQFSGYVDKYAGDGIMAVFEGKDMAVRACLCALEIIRHARELLQNQTEQLFSVGCGINLGTAVIGNIGSPEHLDYSAVGEAVNLAARLCGLAEPMSIVISESVRTQVRHAQLAISEQERLCVKGFNQALSVYHLQIPDPV